MADILDAIGPFHLFSKLFGLTIFSINRETLRAVITKNDVFLYVFTITCNISVYTYLYNMFASIESLGSEITNITAPIVYGLSMMLVYVTIISQFLLRQRIASIIQKFLEVDFKVSSQFL